MSAQGRVLEGFPIAESLIDAVAHEHGIAPSFAQTRNERHILHNVGNNLLYAVTARKELTHHSPTLLKLVLCLGTEWC